MDLSSIKPLALCFDSLGEDAEHRDVEQASQLVPVSVITIFRYVNFHRPQNKDVCSLHGVKLSRMKFTAMR